MTNSQTGKIVLTFESDWHIGMGAGIPGSTDRLIFRDADGFPACPAKTLNGIWRDAMEILCDGLGDGWGKWVEFIFGNQPAMKGANPTIKPFQSTLNLRPAQIPEDLRNAIGDDEKLKQALTFIKAGIAIDNQSGTAKENCLRFEEMGRSGTILEAEFDIQTDNETAKVLLVLSAALIDRIGGKRRRGAGKCKFEIEGLLSKKEAIEHLETFKDKDAPEIPKRDEKSNDIDLEKAEESTDWQTLKYKLTLKTPVSIVTAVLGNVSESLDFIPGTYLLPHITKSLAKNVRSSVANGDFQVSPATIEVEDERGFPIPKVFAQEKMNKTKIYNRLKDKYDKETPQTKPIREGYISDLDSDTLSIATNPPTLLIHNTVDDRVQRPTENVGGVFSRQAIKAETVLRGEIRWKKSLNLKDEDFQKLESFVRLGTSKKDDYGLAEFEIIEKKTNAKAEREFGKELVLYLASDVLLRNDNLRQTNLVEDFARELSNKLGVELTEVKAEKGLISSIIQVRRIESWQVSWGFPRPTLTAMAAGSVVVFECSENVNETKLKEIEASGIGERRGEGYGQIVFNPKILEISIPHWQDGELTKSKKPDKQLLPDDDFSRQIELTAWREELKVAVLKIAAEKDLRKEIFGFEIRKKENGEKESIPPMSQIGGLRSAISRLQVNKNDEKSLAENRKVVVGWLDHLSQTENRRKKWSENQAEANKKLTKIKTLIQTDEEVWKILKTFKIGDRNVWNAPKILTARNLEKDKKLWAEAVRALFYACQHAHKRELEKNGGEKTEAANG